MSTVITVSALALRSASKKAALQGAAALPPALRLLPATLALQPASLLLQQPGSPATLLPARDLGKSATARGVEGVERLSSSSCLGAGQAAASVQHSTALSNSIALHASNENGLQQL